MNLQPILENKLIIIRPLEENDFEPLYKVAQDPLIWEQHPVYDRHKKAVYTEFFKDSLASKGALIIIDKPTNKIIGSSRFKPVNNVKSAVEIGWSFLSREYWGGTFNKAMKDLMIAYAFTFETIEDVVLYIGKENIRSQKATEKIGGIRITESKYQYLTNGNQADWTYRINKKNVTIHDF